MFGVHKMVKDRLKILKAFVARFLMCDWPFSEDLGQQGFRVKDNFNFISNSNWITNASEQY